MPLTVRVENERGELIREIYDFANVLTSLDASSSSVLRFIDPWGDTTLNRLQIPELVAELENAERQADLTRSARSLIEEVKKLAEVAMTGVHRYLKIVGD